MSRTGLDVFDKTLQAEGPRPAGEALSGISRPGGQHSQTGGSRT